jgi:ubiquinone/menaquinone biosynthesis C-methylase UbiE
MFKNSSDYINAVDVLIKSTGCLNNRVQFLKNEVLPYLPAYDKMLDVGIGCGCLTKHLLPSFKKATLIEPEKDFLENFFFTGDIIIEKIHSYIEDINLPNSTYNLIILSHVLYHIKEPDRLLLLDRAYEAATEGGFVVVIYDDSPARRHLTQYFGEKFFNSNIILEHYKNNYNHFEVSFFNYELKCTHLEQMIEICKVYLNDAFVTVNGNDLKKYINKYLYNSGTYRIKATQSLLKLKKPVTPQSDSGLKASELNNS